ncbi:M16 family metallopeptidase [Brevibacillus sp. GCM10020057]|uniref:M16 family metallopeptidase n=1 Tax=Brevibacillus sp. GCM10020057 TaxID=3317327 RepID=UPI00363E63E3
MQNKIGIHTKCITEQIHNLKIGVICVRYGIGAANSDLPIGTAHFLEHLICSTENRQLYGNLTAMTKRDETIYYLLTPQYKLTDTFNALNTKKTLDFSEDMIERERTIIIREIEQFQLQPRNLILEQLQAALFPNHGYGHSILGNKSQVKKISNSDLKRGLSYYSYPETIVLVGPWEHGQIIQAMGTAGLVVQHRKESHLSFPVILGRGKIHFSEVLRDTPFVGGGWVLPGEKSTNPFAFRVMRYIWEGRIRRCFPSKHFKLRLNQYHYAGVLTLESIEKGSKLSDLETILLELRRPISKNEYCEGVDKTTLEIMRQKENLISRSELLLSCFRYEMPSWEELQLHQQIINKHLYMDIGVYGSSIDSTCSTYTIEKNYLLPQLVDSTNENRKNNGDQCYKPLDKPPSSEILLSNFKIKNSSQSNRYWTVASSPLTERYHVLFRLPCLYFSRLLQPKDLPFSILQKGVLENVRYEGWDTLFQVAFTSNEEMQEVLHTATSTMVPIQRQSYINTSEYYMQNIELELKWRILEAIRPIVEKSVNASLKLNGLSIILPENSSITTVELDRWFEKTDKEEINGSYVKLVNGAVIGARFNGAAVICPLPYKSLASLIIQEAAFGVGKRSFLSLENLTRSKGLSYRIVQSLCRIGNEIFIFWGIQCPPKLTNTFYETVKEWLISLRMSVKDVELWFRDIWTPFSPNKHKSILQLLRDMDRMGYYALPDESPDALLDNYLRQMLENKMIEVSFRKF